MKPLVYVAGPYTRPDPIVNTRNAILAGDRIYRESLKRLYPFVPHLTLLWHMVAPAVSEEGGDDVEYWYEFDLNAIDHADALLRLPGASTGADREVEYARSIGVPVFDSVDDVLAHYDLA